MRRILVNHARDQNRLKRGGGRHRVDLDRLTGSAAAWDDDLVELDEALDRLSKDYPAVADLVKLRFFAGMTLGESADALGLPRRTADRHWAFARAWLADASVDVTDARNDQAGRQTHRWSVFRSLITGQSVSSNSSPPEFISSLRLRTIDNLKKRRATKLHSTASCEHQIECVPHFTHVCLSAYPTPGAIQPGACRFALAGCARLLSP